MPTYQYACTECGHSFEQFQSFSEDALTVCPECDGRLRKLYNAVGVVFKGSGFYRTDSRSDASSSAPASTSASTSKSSSSSSSSSSSDGGSSSSSSTAASSSSSSSTSSSSSSSD
ncbi:FmdB family zinc ribbon protein [uncultured Nocardioides sp.]|uniref:FmdB family zinc ribbon protein n=1 Tax=uncultured Nocardioides sp. TaxID=198441 RepID=UPI002612AAE0|nr:FmdB family zinc ribbon protein [uncultured Nocardioides sp.]